MSVSISLLAKVFAGTSAVVAPVVTGVIYRKEIKKLLVSGETNETKKQNEQQKDEGSGEKQNTTQTQ